MGKQMAEPNANLYLDSDMRPTTQDKAEFVSRFAYVDGVLTHLTEIVGEDEYGPYPE